MLLVLRAKYSMKRSWNISLQVFFLLSKSCIAKFQQCYDARIMLIIWREWLTLVKPRPIKMTKYMPHIAMAWHIDTPSKGQHASTCYLVILIHIQTTCKDKQNGILLVGNNSILQLTSGSEGKLNLVWLIGKTKQCHWAKRLLASK